MSGACDRCLARAWLLARLAGHLERVRARIEPVLALDVDELIAAVAGEQTEVIVREVRELHADAYCERARDHGLELLCACDDCYPPRLRELPNHPAVLHVAGGLSRFLDLVREEPVAIVGSRRASSYGLEMARSLASSLAATGVTVISGMALGIDSAAHEGTLSAAQPSTIAVLPCGAERPYPAARRALHRRLVAGAAVVSELPPGTSPWRWTFPARNRIIAGLAAMTIVVEAGERSGALVTARVAAGIARPVGAVPGQVTTPAAVGTNALLAEGAHVIRDAQDVLDHLYGVGVTQASARARGELTPELEPLLAAVAEGHDTAAALERAGFPPGDVLPALASLELAGYVRRDAGGRFVVRP